MRGEIVREGIGKGSIYPHKVNVNELCTFHITYQVGKTKIKTGGMVRFEFPYPFSAPHILFPYAEGYVKAESSNKNVRFSLEVLPEGYESKHPVLKKEHFYYVTRYGQHLLIKIEEGEFYPGDVIKIVYGQGLYLNPAARTPYFSGNFEFTIAVKPAPDTKAPFSGFYLIPKSPSVKVEGGRAEKITVFVPSVNKGKKLTGSIIVRDKFNNLSPDYKGKIIAEVGGKSLDIVMDSNPHKFSFNCEETISRIEVKGKGISGKSNPSIRNADYRLYWGDIHGHTLLSDGLGTAEEYYQYAKNHACLDFSAISDHAQYLGEEDWEDIKNAAEKFYKAKEFVTILGHEYSSGNGPAHNELNIYYPHLDASLIQSCDIYQTPSRYARLSEVLEKVKEKKGMTIIHQHARGNRVYVPDVVRLIEIYSIWGSAEYPGNPYPLMPEKNSGVDYHGYTVQDYLSQGWLLGFTGGSDCHAGHPGESDWLRRGKGYHNGLTGVWAENLTREKIWEALYSRRCYGTTGARIILNFTLNEKPMGSEIKETGERRMKVEVHATAEIRTIEIIKNNKNIHVYQGKESDETIEYVDKKDRKVDFYYVRVYQKDGSIAWSSPIWVFS